MDVETESYRAWSVVTDYMWTGEASGTWLPVVVCVLEVPHLHLVPGEGTRVRHAEGKRDLRLSVFWFCRESIVGV